MAAVTQSLSPTGAQLVFRAVLDALARPGTIHRLPSASAEPLAARVPAALLPVLALADLTTARQRWRWRPSTPPPSATRS